MPWPPRPASSQVGGPFDAMHARLVSLSADLDDTVDELRRQVDLLDEDPERLEEVGARRHLLHDLRRKYGETLTDVLAYRDEVVARLAEVESHDERVAELEAELAIGPPGGAGGGRGGRPGAPGGRARAGPCRPGASDRAGHAQAPSWRWGSRTIPRAAR